MSKQYTIKVKEGFDKRVLFSLTTVIDELPHRPSIFIADCTEEELNVLKAHESYKTSTLMSDLTPQALATKTVKTFRRKHIENTHYTGTTVDGGSTETTGYSSPKYGNWGLIRHSSITNNVALESEVNHTYTYTNDGTGVDVVLHLADRINTNDPEFMTNGVSRIQQFQWNTVTGFSNLPDMNYTNYPFLNNAFSRYNQYHAEAVAYIACGNTYGWATGAKIYPIYWGGAYQISAPNSYDVVKKFHQEKIAAGNTRPTIMIDSFAHTTDDLGNFSSVGGGNFLIFRGNKYDTISPDGIGDRTLAQGNHECRSYGFLPVSMGAGKFSNIQTDLGSSPTYQQVATYINDLSNMDGTFKDSVVDPKNEMIAAGVHAVSAAGNSTQYDVLPDHPDYNNFYCTQHIGSDKSSVELKFGSPYNRGGLLSYTNSIMAGALSTEFGNQFLYDGKETLATFSNRGNRIDAVAAGVNIEMELYTKKAYEVSINSNRANLGHYNASGTSFASPNIGGMAALVLQEYPTTTPKQLRRYFRDIAVGTDKLYDTGLEMSPSSKYGDQPWFTATYSSMGYSGNIAYLDHNFTSNPTLLPDTDPTTTDTPQANQINYTRDEINTKLAT